LKKEGGREDRGRAKPKKQLKKLEGMAM